MHRSNVAAGRKCVLHFTPFGVVFYISHANWDQGPKAFDKGICKFSEKTSAAPSTHTW